MTQLVESEQKRPTNYFWKEKFVLRVLGLSLNRNESQAYKIYSFFFLLLFNYTYPFLDFRDVFKHNFSVIADILIYQFACFVGMAKTTVVLRNRTRFSRLLEKLEKAPFIANFERGGDVELKLIKNCVFLTHIQTLIYWIIVSTSIFFGIIYTFILRLKSNDPNDWEFTYGPFTILNVTYSPNFEISWLYQNIAVASIGYHFTTIDLITASVLCHISVQFIILQNNFQRIVRNAQTKMKKETNESLSKNQIENLESSEIPWKYLKCSLEDAVHYHWQIIDLVKDMEEVFSGLLLLVFLGTLGMLCFLVYHTSLLPLNDVRLIRTLAEAASACLQVLTICYWGEHVIFESQQLPNAAYNSDCVGTDVRFQKALLFVIRRSHNPCKLTAGKFADICLATFTWILRTSYSAFMVLRKNNSNKIIK